jgi:hypothetical protein
MDHSSRAPMTQGAHSVYAVILTFADCRIIAPKAICQLFANFPGTECCLCLPKMSSGANAVEISDIQEDEMEASLVRRSEWNNVTLR